MNKTFLILANFGNKNYPCFNCFGQQDNGIGINEMKKSLCTVCSIYFLGRTLFESKISSLENDNLMRLFERVIKLLYSNYHGMVH